MTHGRVVDGLDDSPDWLGRRSLGGGLAVANSRWERDEVVEPVCSFSAGPSTVGRWP